MEELYKDICYKKSNLKQVIFKVDFPKLVDNERLFDDAIDTEIIKYFPIRGKNEIKYYNELNVATNVKTGDVQGRTTRFQGMERTYFNPTKMNKMILANDTIAFTYNDYHSFEELLESVMGILQQLWKKQKLTAVRCGLRYINLYNLLPTDKKVSKTMFSTKVSKVMEPSLVSDQNGLKPVRSMITTEYIVDDIKVMYRAGIYNQFYPMPISKDDYAIDIDCYTNSAMDTVEDIGTFTEKAHGIIQFLFEQSISDKMRGAMMKND